MEDYSKGQTVAGGEVLLGGCLAAVPWKQSEENQISKLDRRHSGWGNSQRNGINLYSGSWIIRCVYGMGEGQTAEVSKCLWNVLGRTGEGLRCLFPQEAFGLTCWFLSSSRLSSLPCIACNSEGKHETSWVMPSLAGNRARSSS